MLYTHNCCYVVFFSYPGVTPHGLLIMFSPSVPIFSYIPVPVLVLSLLVHPLHLFVISFLLYLNSLLCASRGPVLRLECCVSTPCLNELSSSMLLNELLDLSSSSCAFLNTSVTPGRQTSTHLIIFNLVKM